VTARSTALVTGASSGIGLEIARAMAQSKHDLVLVARSMEKLRQLESEFSQSYGVNVCSIEADLGRQDAWHNVASETERRGLQVDWLVNNAGFGAVCDFTEIPYDRQQSMIDVNISALVGLSFLFLPKMISRKYGGILNVASTAAFQPGPGMSVYYATKAFVLSFSEGLYEESRQHGVKVSCLCPGATLTGFGQESGMNRSILFRMGAMKASHVASASYRGWMKGQAIIVPGIKNKLGAMSTRFTPRWVVRRLVRYLNSTTSWSS
jgi:uncharacterized protein